LRSVFTRPGIVWWIWYSAARCETFVNDEWSHAMIKRRFQFSLKGLLLAVVLLAGLMLLLRPHANDDARIIAMFGPVQVRRDGSIEVQGGSVRMSQGNKQTEIQANRIVVQSDGTAEVYGPGTMVQTTR
jgi:hypothetical protein